MNPRSFALASTLCWTLLHPGPTTSEPNTTEPLDFEARVRAQAALERVYHSHRIDAPDDFDDAVAREVLEAKVRRFLRQSWALERRWKTTVTAQMLDRELERMTRETLDPARLWELFEALDGDPVLVRECLARPILVDRLVRNFFVNDPLLHAEARGEAERLRARLFAGRIDAGARHPYRHVVEWTVAIDDEATGTGGEMRPEDPLFLDEERFAAWRALAPAALGEIGQVVERRDAFEIRVVLEDEPGRARVAVYSVPKRRPEPWWNAFESRPVPTVANAGAGLPPRDFEAPCADSAWIPNAMSPSPREDPLVVWTGSEMLVFQQTVGGGRRYDPATDTWSDMSEVGQPAAGLGSTAVWTGTEAIVWGGYYELDYEPVYSNEGGRYDPSSDSWQPTSTAGAPEARAHHTAVWTGTEMIVWGGTTAELTGIDTGARYDPATDSWSPTSSYRAPGPRELHTAVWTGTRMIVWGGQEVVFETPEYRDDGGIYDPARNRWSQVSDVGAPGGSIHHTAIWTGERMIVWGRFPSSQIDPPGGIFDPRGNSWSPISTDGAPETPYRHTAVWTGEEMIVWGGSNDDHDYADTAGRYDPATDTWSPVASADAPSPRERHAAVWTGSLMIVWGGYFWDGARHYLGDGARFDPTTDGWTPTAEGIWDGEQWGHSLVWTGNEVIEWGGRAWPGKDVRHENTGVVYNPVTGATRPTSLAGAPAKRRDHTAVWTGREMLVWGGIDSDPWPDSIWMNSGGRYDPIADSWAPTSLQGAPHARELHTAVWTGDRMLVWGGTYVEPDAGATSFPVDGGRYDPAEDAWEPISIVDAPAGRRYHSAVWTGAEMIVWGGSYRSPDWFWFDTGGRYDPGSDSWTPTSTATIYGPRDAHTAVWTGAEMIVWGGRNQLSAVGLDTGARYDPQLDLWTAITDVEAPGGRLSHTAVWTGDEMVVWGGKDQGGTLNVLGDGRRYHLASGTWLPLSTQNAPSARAGHEAVWTGTAMIPWGGYNGYDAVYDPSFIDTAAFIPGDIDGDGLCSPEDCDLLNPHCGLDCTDADLDGYCVTSDCNETDGNTHPGAPELNDGLDNQCPGDPGYGIVDEIDGFCGFYNPADANEFSCPPQAGATRYEVARSPHPEFPSQVGCLRIVSDTATWVDTDPVPEATCFYYLVRAHEPNTGSWGVVSSGVERIVSCHR
jgi:N-acetylneuraminic acid mutarotase